MMDKKQERTWASACHLSTLLWIPLSMIGLAIPFINIVAPAFIWYLAEIEGSCHQVQPSFEPVVNQGFYSLNFLFCMIFVSNNNETK